MRYLPNFNDYFSMHFRAISDDYLKVSVYKFDILVLISLLFDPIPSSRLKNFISVDK